MLNGSLADKVADLTDDLEDYTFAENLGIITDVEVGPDGNLYVLTGVRETEGKIYRIMPFHSLDRLAILFLLVSILKSYTCLFLHFLEGDLSLSNCSRSDLMPPIAESLPGLNLRILLRSVL